MHSPGRWTAAVTLLALSTTAATAQVTNDLLERGLQAYRDLDFSTAAALFRRALSPSLVQRLSVEDRVRTLTYLGAAELFRGNRDSAEAAFERVVVLDPRYLIDELVFPPEISTRFWAVRRRTPAVAVVTPPTLDLLPGRDRFPLVLYASAPHEVAMELRSAGGGRVRPLYRGLVGDSLRVEWDGRDAEGAAVGTGQYLVVIESRGSSGVTLRYVNVPLDIAAQRPDTLPDPGPFPDSLVRRERRDMGKGLTALAAGTLGSLAVAFLPDRMAPGAQLSRGRFLIGGTIGLAGAVGFVREVAGRTSGAGSAANQSARQAWNERREAVIRENASRRASAPLVIRAAPPNTIDLRER